MSIDCNNTKPKVKSKKSGIMKKYDVDKLYPANRLDTTVKQNQAKVLSELKKVQANPFFHEQKKILKNEYCNLM